MRKQVVQISLLSINWSLGQQIFIDGMTDMHKRSERLSPLDANQLLLNSLNPSLEKQFNIQIIMAIKF